MSIHAVKTPAARARRVMVVLALLAVAAIFGPQAFATESTEPVLSDTYTVVAGETLWSIAALVTSADGDVRDTVAAIQELNGMESASLRAGQQILIPSLGG